MADLVAGRAKLIRITKGKTTLVDSDMYEEANSRYWHYGAGYAMASLPRPRVSNNALKMHSWINQTPDGFQTDHINGNRLDNRRCNLRTVTASQNRMNRTITAVSTTGFKGVTRKGSRFIARVGSKDSGKIYLGCFKTPEEAHAAYLSAAKKLHGEFFYECADNVPLERLPEEIDLEAIKAKQQTTP